MYAYSLPGETGKRELDAEDLEAINALYHDDSGASGCGGATIAGRSSGTLGWFMGACLLSLGGFIARRRAARRHAWSAALGLGLLLDFSPRSDVTTDSFALEPAQSVVVTASESHWEDQLIVTNLELASKDCAAGLACPTERATVLGGEVDGVVQVVGHLRPPPVGAELTRRMRNSSAHEGEHAHGWISTDKNLELAPARAH
jgi:hypothetical protein